METSSLLLEDPFGPEASRDWAKAAFLIHLVALVTGVPPAEIVRPSRATGRAARARWLSMYLMNVALSVPLARVAAVFGRDRTTVGQAVGRMEDCRSNAVFDRALAALERCALAVPLDVPSEALQVRTASERRRS